MRKSVWPAWVVAGVVSWSVFALGAAPGPRAVVLQAQPAPGDGAATALAEAAAGAGYRVEHSDPEAFFAEQPGAVEAELILIPHGRALPLTTIPSLRKHLERGANLIACGLPLWDDEVLRVNGQPMTRIQREALLASVRPGRMLLDFEAEDLSQWHAAADPGSAPSRRQLAAGPSGKALRVTVPQIGSWSVLSRNVGDPFPPGHTVTCFRAKGGPRTRHLMVEWTEKDGSRWIATVDLTEQWRSYALRPESFVAWMPSGARGGPGDRLRVADAQRLIIGLGRSHMTVDEGEHEYWIDELGTAADPAGELSATPEKPHLEGLSPSYLFYPVSGDARLALAGARETLPAPASLLAMHPRAQATGIHKDRPWRWQPLVEALGEHGEYRGAVAALVLPLRKPHRGGAWAVFTPDDSAFYQQPPLRALVLRLAQRIRGGVFLEEGGASSYTLSDGESARLGARLLNLGSQTVKATVRLAVEDERGKRVQFIAWPVEAKAGESAACETSWIPPSAAPAGYRVQVELVAKDQVVDQLSHPLHVWRPRTNPSFIAARQGGFWLNGAPWKAHGVNYMPSSGIGQSEWRVFEHWIGAAGYDPIVIDRDLRRIVGMKMNAVSVFIDHQSLPARNMVDFLRRCEELGLKVNLSLRPGTPMDFQWEKMREMIQSLRLAGSDTVFAYDLAWEPSHYDYKHQRRYAAPWKAWVENRYGSIQAAERAWGVPAPREQGTLTVPPPSQRLNDGPWRKMIADYRLFLDELVGGKYAEARRLVRSIDPNHPVSFRMQMSGDPTFNDEGLFPYDFKGLAGAVDIWEPEAYGRIGPWERVRPGHFTAAYARLCDPDKPVLWAEMGHSIWDMKRMAPDPDKLAFAGRYYRDFYRMMRESGADGVFFWWYPGGYRLNEKSDFGIINPDGTDRPTTRVIRDEADAFLAAPKLPRPSYWIAVDRDRDARGLFGIYQSVQAEYWRAVEAGKTVGLGWSEPR